METKDIPALIERLRYFNDWRRGADGEQPNPEQIGRDIDAAVAILSRQASAPDPLSQNLWVAFDVAEPQGCEVVQQYLGAAVMEHSNPPDWAFPTARWRGEKDSAATHWRYVDAPNS